MKLRIAWISGRKKAKNIPLDTAFAEYVKRLARYQPVETQEYAEESALLQAVSRGAGRTAAVLVALDSAGKQLSSEEFADLLRKHQERGTQRLLFGVGPADGWSETARASATLKLSLGKITLAHELARVVLLEQLYRAFTIIAGHPYHTGH